MCILLWPALIYRYRYRYLACVFMDVMDVVESFWGQTILNFDPPTKST